MLNSHVQAPNANAHTPNANAQMPNAKNQMPDVHNNAGVFRVWIGMPKETVSKSLFILLRLPDHFIFVFFASNDGKSVEINLRCTKTIT